MKADGWKAAAPIWKVFSKQFSDLHIQTAVQSGKENVFKCFLYHLWNKRRVQDSGLETLPIRWCRINMWLKISDLAVVVIYIYEYKVLSSSMTWSINKVMCYVYVRVGVYVPSCASYICGQSLQCCSIEKSYSRFALTSQFRPFSDPTSRFLTLICWGQQNLKF